MQNAKHPEITQRVWAKVDALPQREAIGTGDARAWVDYVVGTYGELAIWHAARAGGFGGSQIGALVKNFMGERADHEQSAHDIVAGALLRKVPDEPNGHMLRGIAMEPQHRRWFHEKYGSTRDEAGFTLLSRSTGSRPWMRYSPDDLALLTDAGSGEITRHLIDYKAPSNVDQSASVAFQYVCQLHMGRLVCEHNGLHIDGLMLSQFDWANWALKDDAVPYIADLDQLIEQAGDHYWEFVMRGEVPAYVRKARLENEDALREQLGHNSLKLARLKAMSSAIDKHIKTLEDVIKPEIAKFHLGRSKVVLEGISFSATPKFTSEEVLNHLPLEVFESLPLAGNATKAFDDKAMLARLKELNEDVKKFAKPASVDGEALYDALVAHNVDADALMGEQLTGRVDKKLSADVAAWVERELSDFIYTPEQGNEIEAAAEEAAAELDGREGQEVLRSVPRSVNA